MELELFSWITNEDKDINTSIYFEKKKKKLLIQFLIEIEDLAFYNCGHLTEVNFSLSSDLIIIGN